MNWKNIPSLSALRAFEATARTGSFSKAAAELNVTHAAIAQHVRQLENHFQLPLVFRNGRGMAMTPHGESLAQGLKDGFEQIIFAIETLHRRTQDQSLRVSMTPSFAANWMMPRIGGFWSSHPQIKVEISPTADLVDLKRDQIDMAIRFGTGDWPGLSAEHLTSGEFVAVAHPSLLEGRKVSCLQDVADLPFILDSYVQEHSALIEDNGVALADLDIKSMEQTALVDAALFAGAGVCIRNRAFFDTQIADGTLQVICELGRSKLSYYVVHPKGSLGAQAKAFKNWVLKSAKETKCQVN